MNSSTVLDIDAGNNNLSTQFSEAIIFVPFGTTTLSMKSYGYTPDTYGPNIFNVTLKKITFKDSSF